MKGYGEQFAATHRSSGREARAVAAVATLRGLPEYELEAQVAWLAGMIRISFTLTCSGWLVA